QQPLVWLEMGNASHRRPTARKAAPIPVFRDLRQARVIVLLHPRCVKPKNRRFPLSILSIAAVLEGKEEYVIIDGNLDSSAAETLDRIVAQHTVEMVAVSVMPGPQMVSAIPLCRDLRRKHPRVPVVWGGYFPSLYATAALNAAYVDFAVRGPGDR